MRNKIVLLGGFLVLLGVVSCKKNASRMTNATKIVSEWVGKEIEIPSDVHSIRMESGDTCSNPNTPFKILVYTDSIGCTSCKLQLYKWNFLIKEASELMEEKVGFHFYFHPKDEKELKYLFKRDGFKHPVYIDREDKLNRLNKLPENTSYQCFLLDKNNRVLLIGNPISNPKLWELYKQTVMGKETTEERQHKLTTVGIERTEIELKDIKVNETSIETFILNNTGEIPLAIKDITAPCGCTIPEWERKPIPPGDKTEIKVKVTPEARGYFQKSVTVFCNTEKGTIKLTIKGIIKEG